ncbi:MAG: leucine-rich repeat protein [Clostridia bacterium]|nr:leucine-rich repeat protein [Clostridia bacterium]
MSKILWKLIVMLGITLLLMPAAASADVLLPSEMTVIEAQAFINDTSLGGKLTIPEGVTTIGAEAFAGCTGLTEVVIPDSVTAIEAGAFSGCTGLSGVIVLPENCRIEADSFLGCAGLIVSTGLPPTPMEFFTYEIQNQEAHITSYDDRCAETEIVVPDIIDGYPVTKINNYVFDGASAITSARIPRFVTYIGEYGFYGCSLLSDVRLPDAVTNMGDSVFEECVSLTGISLPASLVELGASAFYGCENLAEVTVPKGLERIGGYSFYGCTSLKEMVIPQGVTEIEDRTFYACTSLQNVTIEGAVTNVGKQAFYTCTNLQSLRFPQGLLQIGERAFSSCFALQEAVLPDTVTEIAAKAFYSCKSLKSMTIPAGVTALVDDLFYGCEGLESVTLPAGLKTIGKNCFRNCKSLLQCAIPDGVTEIGSAAFYSCRSLKSFVAPESLTSIGSKAFAGCMLFPITLHDQCVFASDAFEPDSTVMIYGSAFNYMYGYGSLWVSEFDPACGMTEVVVPAEVCGHPVSSVGSNLFLDCTDVISVILPDSVTSVGHNAFDGCTKLTNVLLPAGLTSIYDQVFRDCVSLTGIAIPESVTNIGAGAFNGCAGLTDITIPDGVTNIGDYAFSSCTGLTDITIPDGVTSIGGCSFLGCTNLTGIIIPAGVTSIGDRTFDGCTSLAYAVLPEDMTSIGYGAFWNCESLAEITIPDGVTSIGVSAFNSCTSLMEITIPDSVTSIGGSAFAYCTSLVEITIPAGVTSISGYAFRGCSALESVTLMKGLTSIGEYAFMDCTSLVEITIPAGVTSISGCAFRGCSALESVTLMEGLTSIGEYAFMDCTSLTEIAIPDGVTQIARYTFSDCSNLMDVTIPASVTSIGEYAFWDCERLTEIVIPEGVVFIGDRAFAGCKALASVVLPEGLTSIEPYAFSRCALKSIAIPEGVTSIGEGAFYWTPLMSLTIPQTVTAIADDAFEGHSPAMTVYGEPGSYAESYCDENNIIFSTEPFPGDLEDDVWIVLSGSVKLSDETVLPGARITVYQEESVTSVASTETNADGLWSIARLYPDTTYRIVCELEPLTFEDVLFTTSDVSEAVPTLVAEVAEEYVLVPMTVVRAEAGAAAVELNIISSDAWTASVDSDWITLSAGSGAAPGQTVTAVVSANEGAVRVGQIQVTCGSQSISIPVVQAGATAAKLDAPTITTPAEDGLELPYDSVTVTWEAVENAAYYVISLRDLTTDTLLIYHEKQALGSACTTLLPAEYFFMGREYRIAVGAVPPGLESTDSMVGWSERVFSTPAEVLAEDATISGRVCEYEYISEETDESGNIVTEATINMLPLDNITVELFKITETEKLNAGSMVTGADGLFTFTGCEIGATYIIELTSNDIEFATLSREEILALQSRTNTTVDLEDAVYSLATDAGENETGDITGIPKLGDGHQSWFRSIIADKPNGLWAEYFQFRDGNKNGAFSDANKRWEYGYSPYDFANGVLKPEYQNSYIRQIDFRWTNGRSQKSYSYVSTTKYDGSGSDLIIRYVSTKNFAAFFNGYLRVPTDDRYTFRLTGDDGIELSLQYAVVEDDYEKLKEYGGKKWYNGFAKSVTTKGMELKAGTIMPLVIKYYNSDGVAKLKFEYKTKTDGTWRIVPNEWLYMGGRAYNVDDSWIKPAVTMDQIDAQVHAAFDSMTDQVIGNYIDKIVSETITPTVFAQWDDQISENWVQEVISSGYQGAARAAYEVLYGSLVDAALDPSTMSTDKIWQAIVDKVPYLKSNGENYGLDLEAVGDDAFETLVKALRVVYDYDPFTYKELKVTLDDIVLYDQIEKSMTAELGVNTLLDKMGTFSTAGKLVDMLHRNFQRVSDEKDMNRLRSFIHLSISEVRNIFEKNPAYGPYVDGMSYYQRMIPAKILNTARRDRTQNHGTCPLPVAGSALYYVYALDGCTDADLERWFNDYYDRSDVEVMLYKQLLIDTVNMAGVIYGDILK